MKLTQLEGTLIFTKMVITLGWGTDLVDKKEHVNTSYHILFDELGYYNE